MDVLNEKKSRDGQPIYSLGDQKPIAYCVLVANTGENTSKPIYSTENDLQYVATTFARIGAKIEFQRRYKGMERLDVENLLNTLKATNLKRCPCFVFFYSGHGGEAGIQLDETSSYPFHKIVDSITALPCLKGKPKVFIFDCCRVYNGPKCNKNCKVESYTDCVIAYACSKGEQAFITDSKYTKNNSVFTKAFCSMLMSKHHRWSLVSILVHASSLTNRSMKEYYHAQARLVPGTKDEEVASQTPDVIVKLRKQLYLCCKWLPRKMYLEKCNNIIY